MWHEIYHGIMRWAKGRETVIIRRRIRLMVETDQLVVVHRINSGQVGCSQCVCKVYPEGPAEVGLAGLSLTAIQEVITAKVRHCENGPSPICLNPSRASLCGPLSTKSKGENL